MEITVVRYIMMSVDYLSALILILILACCVLEKNKTTLLEHYICMAAACVVALLLEAVAFSVSVYDQYRGSVLRMILNNGTIICGYALTFFYTCYVSNLVGSNRRACRLAVKVLQITGIAAACILLAGSFSGVFFSVRGGTFNNGRFFIYAFMFDILACLTGILLIVRYRRNLNRRDIIALSSLPTFIFITAVAQYNRFQILYGLFLMASVALVIIYLMIQTDRNKRTLEQEKQLTDLNVAMMLSQIQPHFLYNALSSIRRMIRKDPAVAEAAVENFSLYLRQNLESMSRVEPISFATELKHVEEYLYLEKLRFGDRLQVEYDIAYAEFALPVLTLQPIVENAVKHGILKREEGGCVKISTRRQGGTVLLTVEDDGVGFVPDAVETSDRLHIGFKNVERRIQVQCKGKLEVESTVGSGTVVTMTLPLI